LVRIPRFYCPEPIAIAAQHSTQIELDARLAHHAFRVLRLRRGDAVTLFDGTGGEWEASVHSLDAKRMTVVVGGHAPVERESPLRTCIVQALSSGERMTFTLEKCVELGATRFQPVESERSVVRLKDERAQRRQQHWQQVVIAACEQCGRNTVPIVAESLALVRWLATLPTKVRGIVLSPDGAQPLARIGNSAGLDEELLIAVGPEGGFTDIELDLLERRGFVRVNLGPRTLRTETAAAAALAALQACFGDFR
jgi:16S rRNA (uracil1498-N3)-methyltransferase